MARGCLGSHASATLWGSWGKSRWRDKPRGPEGKLRGDCSCWSLRFRRTNVVFILVVALCLHQKTWIKFTNTRFTLFLSFNGWHHIHTLQVRRVCVSAQSWWDLWGFKGCHGDSWRGARLWKDEEEDEEELLSMLQRSRERGAKLIPDNSTVCATEVSYLRPRTTKAEPELIQEDCCCEGHLSPRDKGEIETILGMIICLVWPETVWYPCTHVTSVKRNKWLQVRCTARRGV